MLKYIIIALAFLTVVYAEPCSEPENKSAPSQGVVTLSNGNATGTITFTKTDKGISITGTISGLKEGKHGFHIHEIGNITGGCASTGGHFNPANVTHGAPNDTIRHVGDLGNIVANADGIAELNFTDSIITLEGDNNIIGRGVVVHADEDDLGLGGFEDSKTTGHAGARVGCGVIKYVVVAP